MDKEIKTKQLNAYAWEDNKNDEYVYEAFVKVPKGIKHLVFRNKELLDDKSIEDMAMQGSFSRRPFVLGQNCDGSIDYSVLALYHHYCMTKQIDPMDYLIEAYGKDEKRDFNRILAYAKWEGVKYPKEWNTKAICGLLYSLYQINFRSLTEVIELKENIEDDWSDINISKDRFVCYR